MKTSFVYLFILVLIASNFSISSPNIISAPNQGTLTSFDLVGSWAGTLKISSVELRIVFNVAQDPSGKLTANLDSPDQGAYGIAVDDVIVKGDSIKFIIGVVKGFYAGKIYPDVVKTKYGYHIIKVTDKRERIPKIKASHILVDFNSSNGEMDTIAAKATLCYKKKQHPLSSLFQITCMEAALHLLHTFFIL